ncbi:MAG TPA: hypothetical protein VFV84_16305, partial [Burkholderiales bacterium]|nr:hypothetical protein [Burkholderiales bacterium]
GQLRERAMGLFGHTGGQPALFSVHGVSLREDGKARHVEHAPASHAHALAGWCSPESGHHGDLPDAKARPAGEHEAGGRPARVDWHDSYHGLGASAVNPGGKRGQTHANLAAFDPPGKGAGKSGR